MARGWVITKNLIRKTNFFVDYHKIGDPEVIRRGRARLDANESPLSPIAFELERVQRLANTAAQKLLDGPSIHFNLMPVD